MKRKTLAALLLALVIGGGGILVATSKSVAKSVNEAADNSPGRAPKTPAVNPQQDLPDEPGVINGAKNPQLIPDQVAYSLLFRLVSGAQNAEAKMRVRSYVKQMVGECSNCPGEEATKDKNKRKEQDTNAFVTTAYEFQQRVSVLDQQAIEIKKLNWPNPSPEVMARLSQLQRQKEVIVAELMASLPKRLSASGANKLRSHVSERVKRNMKMRVKDKQGDTPSLALLSGNNATQE